MKTLLFCTAYSTNQDRWSELFGRWINTSENSKIDYDQLLLIDDGSPVLPNWDGVDVIYENQLPDDCPDSQGVIYHFNNNLGYSGHAVYPGWYRSFMFAAEYAEKYNFDKIIHIAEDAFLISDRIQTYVNNLDQGWTTFWCPRHKFPENNIQIIAGDSVKRFIAWNHEKVPYSIYQNICAEFWIPFTHVNKDFKGDRWGEFAPGLAAVPDPSCPPGVPLDADFVCQISQGISGWWMNETV
jgi:hypothetical protein